MNKIIIRLTFLITLSAFSGNQSSGNHNRPQNNDNARNRFGNRGLPRTQAIDDLEAIGEITTRAENVTLPELAQVIIFIHNLRNNIPATLFDSALENILRGLSDNDLRELLRMILRMFKHKILDSDSTINKKKGPDRGPDQDPDSADTALLDDSVQPDKPFLDKSAPPMPTIETPADRIAVK